MSARALGVVSAFKSSMDQYLNSAKKEDLKFLYDDLSGKAYYEHDNFRDDENIRKRLRSILGDKYLCFSELERLKDYYFGIEESGKEYREGGTKEIRTNAKIALKNTLKRARQGSFPSYLPLSEQRKIRRKIKRKVRKELGYFNFRTWLNKVF